jgi:hypothetical protein
MQYDETARKSIQRESKEFFSFRGWMWRSCGIIVRIAYSTIVFAQQTGYSPQASWDGDPLTRKAGTATGA